MRDPGSPHLWHLAANVRGYGGAQQKKCNAKSDNKWEGILKGGVYHVHKGLGVDESVMWGEYFFCEALERVLF